MSRMWRLERLPRTGGPRGARPEFRWRPAPSVGAGISRAVRLRGWNLLAPNPIPRPGPGAPRSYVERAGEVAPARHAPGKPAALQNLQIIASHFEGRPRMNVYRR